jgi:hypothetical protein
MKIQKVTTKTLHDMSGQGFMCRRDFASTHENQVVLLQTDRPAKQDRQIFKTEKQTF